MSIRRGKVFDKMEKEDTKPSLIAKLNDVCLINILKHLSPKDRIVAERGKYL